MVYDRKAAVQTADLLLQIKTISFNARKPFTWASGWKSPIYCDNRLILSHPHARDFIKSRMAELIEERYPKVQAIAGVATAGIAHGVLVADLLKKPFLYVRPKPKDHGTRSQIEGKAVRGQKVVVIEDLISTGGSSVLVAEALKQEGLEVMGVVAIFTYGLPVSEEKFKASGFELFTLCEFDILIERARSLKILKPGDFEVLEAWKTTPQL